MARFVELHYNGIPFLVNLDQVTGVMEFATGETKIELDSKFSDNVPYSWYIADESYDEVSKRIANATGWIERGYQKGTTYGGD